MNIDEEIKRAQAICDDTSKPTCERLEAATEVCALLDLEKRRAQKAAIAMLMQNCETGK